MACVNPDGSVTQTAKKILRALENPLKINELAQLVLLPVFMLRMRLRELIEYGFIEEREDTYKITEKGRKKI